MTTQTREEAIKAIANFLKPHLQTQSVIPISDFSRNCFYIPETQRPMSLLPHQSAILNYAFDQNRDFQTIVYSTVKKSGKTTIASLAARWIVENWEPFSEVYCLANDLEQARGRIYQKALQSIELDPNYNPVRRELPGKWKIIERQATYLPKKSILRAVSSDYKGEAGSNATATFWSEGWGYTSEASRRLWDELTPVPTRKRSIRFVETYAGFENESDLLLDLYKLGLQGRQLTHDDIDWPFPDRPPIWVNERTKVFMYWDSGELARRMPWQTPEYYEAQAASLRPLAFERLHLNLWTSSISQLLPIDWWDACQIQYNLPGPNVPIVLAADASVSSDCTALIGVCRGKALTPAVQKEVVLVCSRVWYPPVRGSIDYGETIEPAIKELCKQYNVVEIAYDAYQLHKLMTDLTRDAVGWCRSFSQNAERERADKQLHDLIRDRRIGHYGDPAIREHFLGAAAKQKVDEDTKMRIIKRGAQSKIDMVVALSMATAECLRLNLD